MVADKQQSHLFASPLGAGRGRAMRCPVARPRRPLLTPVMAPTLAVIEVNDWFAALPVSS